MANINSKNNLIPSPESITLGDGFFVFNKDTALVANTDVLATLPQEVRSWLLVEQSLLLRQSQHDPVNANRVLLALDQQLAAEAYSVLVDEYGVTVRASSGAGFYYAYQSLRQLAVQAEKQQLSLPYLTLHDAPRYPWRGMMLDVSRHFYGVDFVKRFIDLMAMHKMNVFHWHLTDDQGWRIEIEGYPLLTSVAAYRDETVVGHTSNKNPVYDGKRHGGYYTQQQIRDVVAYAQDKNILIVPEIDVPGHVSALLEAYPQYGCLKKSYKAQTRFGIFVDVLCPTEETFTLIDDIVEQVSSLFPGPYLHIGGDEVKTDHWRDCDACQALMKREGLTSLRKIQGYFVSRIGETAAKYGKKLIGWDEVLEGDVANSTTIMSWRGMEGGITAAKAGHDVVMTPVSHVYFDFYQSTSLDSPQRIHGLTPLSKVYQFELTPEVLSPTEAKFIKGGQGNVWTEYLPTEASVETAILPRMTALAEALWSRDENKDWDDFSRRLPAFLSQLEQQGYQVSPARFKPLAMTTVDSEGRIVVSFSVDSPNIDIYVWTDHTPEKLYSQPILATKAETYYAVGINRDSGERFGHEVVSVEPHKALAKPVRYLNTPEVTGNPLGGQLLVSGMLATDRIFQYHEWGGFDERGMDASIDLQEPTTVQSLRIGFDTGLHRRLYRPTAITVYISNNEKDWQQVAAATNEAILLADRSLTLKWPLLTARYVRVVAENNNRDYSAEEKREIAMTVHIDELVLH
ncbi:glycoside hydrolase family 20 protein [Sinobacterium caligoides]|nr:family 20 glycosylhydrolase [Sinobacterium caligoides]